MLASGIRSLPRLGVRAQPARQLRSFQTFRTPALSPTSVIAPTSLTRPSPTLVALRPKPNILYLRPSRIALYATSDKPGSDGKSPRMKDMVPDQAKEEELRQSRLEKSPKDEVTTTSSIRDIVEPRDEGAGAQTTGKALEHDVNIVKDTFAMKDVPKDLMSMGLLGLTPYVATSAATLFLAWDINYGRAHGTPMFFSGETAQSLLSALEPIQIGYGAVILSFLGAIHWGLEFAKYGGTHGYKRYAIGVLAPLLAWPTAQLPLDYALLTQFIGFTGMYFADITATRWGWAPAWYQNYRFALTFVVGACIVLTLIGRSQIGDKKVVEGSLKCNEYIDHLRKIQAEYREKEETEIEAREREAREKKEAEKRKKAEGALKAADKAKKPDQELPESSAKRRVRDQDESSEEKETSRGPKKTDKPVDPKTVKGTPDKVPHHKESDSQTKQAEEGKSQKELVDEKNPEKKDEENKEKK